MTMKCAHLWCAPCCENLDTSVLSPLFFGMKESKHDIHHSVPLRAKSKNVQSFSYISLSVSCSNVGFSLTHLHLDGENVLMLTSQPSKYNCPQDLCYRTVAPATYVLQVSTQKQCGQCYNQLKVVSKLPPIKKGIKNWSCFHRMGSSAGKTS